MAWKQLIPVTKTKGVAQVGITITAVKGGHLIPKLSLAAMFYEAFGENTKTLPTDFVIVEVGDGEDTGAMRVSFVPEHTEGAIPVKKGGANTGYNIKLPAFDLMPKVACAKLSCRVIEQGVGNFTIKLPLQEWTDQKIQLDNIQRRAAQTPAAVAPTSGGVTTVSKAEPMLKDTPAPGDKVRPAGSKGIDPIHYLTTKKHKIHRLAEGRFSLDGDTVDTKAIVLLINKYRTQSSLNPIGALDLV